MSKGAGEGVVVIKTVWWRHACYTLFLFIVASFFAFVGRYGLLFSWTGTLLVGFFGLLSLLDQVFEWSRLRIDRDGFSLRGWLRNHSYAHHEIGNFEIIEFAGKRLLAINLSEEARKRRNLSSQPIPFPCNFGRPIDEVLNLLRKSIDRTPRPRG